MFPRSLWVYHANSGGCNGCDIEVLNVLTPYYDVERFGIKLVGSPRHADVMLCQGPAMRVHRQGPAARLRRHAGAEARLCHRLLRLRRRHLVRHLQRPRPGREGGPRQLLHPRLPAAARGHPLRRRRRRRPGGQEDRAGQVQAARIAHPPLPPRGPAHPRARWWSIRSWSACSRRPVLPAPDIDSSCGCPTPLNCGHPDHTARSTCCTLPTPPVSAR